MDTIDRAKYRRVMRIDRQNKFISRFNGNTGVYVRTGVLEMGDNGDLIETSGEPFMAEFPELIDIGIMERCTCSSVCNVDCYQRACDRTGENMSLKDFKWILDQCRTRVFQVALGGAGDPDTHENFGEILEYCHSKNVVPNFTTSGIDMTKEKAVLCRKYCGAVAVSEHFAEYTDRAINILLDSGVRTNIHYVLSKDTIGTAIDILNGVIDYRPGINAIVFLLYKPVGLGRQDKVLGVEDDSVHKFFKALDNRKCSFKVGFDSCSCSGLLNFAHGYDKSSIDFCEGARFSMYISSDMMAMPCSFANQDVLWHYKLDKEHRIVDAWRSGIFQKFRDIMNSSCTSCKDRLSCCGGCPLMEEITLCNRKERS